MSKNCLVVISKNEGTKPITIAEEAIESTAVDKIIISDGSNKENFKKLKSTQTDKIGVIHEKKYLDTEKNGKGIGMVNGGIAAIKEGYDNIGYIDGDIYNPNINKWFNFLFEPLEEEIDLVKAAFSRNPTDGQITRHITKPLIAMFLPNAWEIDQPLGGELALKKEVLKDIISKGIKPPAGWGIDTFITIKSLIHGYTIGEVYLGQKMHGKKTLTNLRKMFLECFKEAVRMIKYFEKLPVKRKIKPIARVASPFKNNPSLDEKYMDIEKEVKNSLETFKLMEKMYLPHDSSFYKIKNCDSFKDFYKKTQPIDINMWVEMLYWFVKKYSPKHLTQYYLRWKIRALSFCLHEINTIEQAEDVTRFQAKSATTFMDRISEKSSFDSSESKKMYFYRGN